MANATAAGLPLAEHCCTPCVAEVALPTMLREAVASSVRHQEWPRTLQEMVSRLEEECQHQYWNQMQDLVAI